MASRDQQLWQYTYAVPIKNSCHQLQAHDRSSPKLNYCENPHTVEKVLYPNLFSDKASHYPL